jgi:hypothetical protein
MTPRRTRLAKRQLHVAIPESIMHMWFRHCTEDTCMFTKLGRGTLLARARGPQLHGSKQNFGYYFNIFVLLFPYVHVNMPRRFSNLSLLRRWLPDAPSVFAKAAECTLLLNLQPPYACGAAIIRPASGFLKSILQSDFVCFKFLIDTSMPVACHHHAVVYSSGSSANVGAPRSIRGSSRVLGTMRTPYRPLYGNPIVMYAERCY